MNRQDGRLRRSHLGAVSVVGLLGIAVLAGLVLWGMPSDGPGAPPKAPGTGVRRSPAGDAGLSGPSLRIDRISLHRPLTPQGLRKGEINPDPGQVIWFTGYGRVAPGAAGVSVVAGHVVRGTAPDVFAELPRVEIGDQIVTTDQDGTETRYTVARAYTTAKEELQRDPAVWGKPASGKRLALVTCDDALGRRSDGHRVANYVVIATAP